MLEIIPRCDTAGQLTVEMKENKPRRTRSSFVNYTVISQLDQMTIVGPFQQNYSILLLLQFYNFRFNNFCFLFLILNFVYWCGIKK